MNRNIDSLFIQDAAREAIELAATWSHVAILFGFPDPEALDILWLSGETETELFFILARRTDEAIALLADRKFGQQQLEISLRRYDKYQGEPWAQRLLDEFQTQYREFAEILGYRTELVH